MIGVRESRWIRMARRAGQYLGMVADGDGAALDGGRGASAPTSRRPVHGGGRDDLVVIVVFAPLTHVDAVRDAAAQAGAGAIGDYRACSFSVTGEGRFEPLAGAQPHIGAVGRPEVVEEQRIEVVCPRVDALRALDAMLAAHPYEEPAWHAYRALSRDDLAG